MTVVLLMVLDNAALLRARTALQRQAVDRARMVRRRMRQRMRTAAS